MMVGLLRQCMRLYVIKATCSCAQSFAGQEASWKSLNKEQEHLRITLLTQAVASKYCHYVCTLDKPNVGV